MKSNANVIHIGLGKTATTALQQNVFPSLERIGIFDNFNDSAIFSDIKNVLRSNPTNDEVKKISSFFLKSSKRHLISHEGIVNWNPEFWESARDRNIKMFGTNSIIIITMREPTDYFRSLYQQKIQSGNIINVNNFFVNSDSYNKSNGFIKAQLCEKFPVDLFSFENLVDLYTEKFETVIVVPYSSISKFNYFKEISNISTSQLIATQNLYKSSKMINKSFSQTAMKITFFRENLLNKLGLKTLGSQDRIHSLTTNFELNNTANKSFYFRLLLKSLTYTSRILSWNSLMINIFSRLINQPYQLPSKLYYGKHHFKNIKFYQTLNELSVGYKIYKKMGTNNN